MPFFAHFLRWRRFCGVAALCGVCIALSTGCNVGRDVERTRRADPGLKAARPVAPAASASAETKADDCGERLRTLRGLPSLPLPEGSLAERAALLLQVKATPVVFLERPVTASTDPVAREWRRRLETSELPGRVLARLLGRFEHAPAFLRAVLLTDGYLYATTATLGATLAEGITLGALFHEPRLVIEHGAARQLVERDEQGGYVYADGSARGNAAHLVLFDRVWAEADAPGAAHHIDLADLQASLGFDSIALERVTSAGIVAVARYGPREVPTVLERNGPSLVLRCEAAGPDLAGLTAARRLAARRRHGVERLREAIRWGVDDSLPFDEPRTEHGQEDGKLRQGWREAYLLGSTHYAFNGDDYAVFDGRGRPLVPEVCIDFILDSFERAGGAWYASRGEPRRRTTGSIDFDATGTLNRRNVEEFVALARRRPDWFELRAVPPEEQVPLQRRPRFLATLFEHRNEYQPGDIVVILGPRSDEKLHYHSFFVFDADPLTGMPTLVAGNSGRPRVRAWVSEMASAPKRSLFARIRPRLPLLEQTLPAVPDSAARPLTAQAEPLRSPPTP